MSITERGGIILSDRLEERVDALCERYTQAYVIIRDDIKIEDAKEAIAQAYITQPSPRAIILAGKSFTIPAQNALLKILEEPPYPSFFILVVPYKNTLVPTIRSRLPLYREREKVELEECGISLVGLDLSTFLAFVLRYPTLDKHHAKAMIEALMHRAMEEEMELSHVQLRAFEQAIHLIELNGRWQSVLMMVLGTFLRGAHHAH